MYFWNFYTDLEHYQKCMTANYVLKPDYISIIEEYINITALTLNIELFDIWRICSLRYKGHSNFG